MNCAKCPHKELVEKARACCLACDPDAQSHHGACHVQANDFTLSHAVNDHTQTEGVTDLPPEVEDKLRKLFATFVGLDPIEALLVLHIARGGTLAAFRAHLDAVVSDVSKYRTGGRGMAWAKFKSIVRRFKPFAAIAGGLIGRGHGGRIRTKPVKTEQLELF